MKNINTGNCIRTWGTRDKGRGEFYENCPAPRDETIVKALNGLLQFELSFGGQVKDIKEEDGKVTIVMTTHVMGCVDTTYFQGTKEDMQSLLEAVHYWNKSRDYDEHTIDQAFAKMTGKNGTVSPFIAKHLGPILIGQGRVRIALLIACGLTEETAILHTAKMKTDDLFAAIGLWIECGNGSPFASFADELGV